MVLPGMSVPTLNSDESTPQLLFWSPTFYAGIAYLYHYARRDHKHFGFLIYFDVCSNIRDVFNIDSIVKRQ